MNDDNHKTLQEFAMGEIIKELRAERDALKAELNDTKTAADDFFNTGRIWEQKLVDCQKSFRELTWENNRLKAELEAARNQEPAVLIEGKKIFWNPEYKGVHEGGFYASPVPALQGNSEREEFNAWNNENSCPLAGRDPKSAAWMAWQARAQLVQTSIPPEHPLRDSMSSLHRSYAEGWNKCRAAMISGEQPAWAKQSLRTNNGNLS